MVSASPYRPEFEAALRLFARASEAMHRRGCPAPFSSAVRQSNSTRITKVPNQQPFFTL